MYDETRKDDSSSQPWPAQTLLDVGVPYIALLESYDSLQAQDRAVVGGVDVATRYVMS